jgi:signal transduction histidine kinase
MEATTVPVEDLVRRLEKCRADLERWQELVASVVHDLRCPLSLVSTTSQLLLARAPGKDRRSARRQLESILRSTAQMTRLCDEMLDFSILSTGKLPLVPRTHDVAEIVREVVELFSPLAQQHQLNLIANGVTGARVSCDRDRIVQVMWNLLDNACRYTPEGGSVTTRVEVREREVRVEVCDSGPGVDPEWREAVFHRYVRRSDPAPRGKGLGLCLARGIVECHGGRIGVVCPPSGGSVFWFTLPR